jgi:hypothetical protein
MAFESVEHRSVKRIVRKKSSRKNSSMNSSVDQGTVQENPNSRLILMAPSILTTPAPENDQYL